MNTPFLPIERMLHRVELARDESDTAYFFDLLYLGEFTIKILAIEILAGMQDDREKHRYSLESRVLRADSIGEWVSALDDALTGPASQHLTPEVRGSQSTLTATKGPLEADWTREAVLQLNDVCRCLDQSVEKISQRKVSIRNWLQSFVWLRNRTRGHGAPTSTTTSSVCSALRVSLDLILANAPAFRRSWAYLHRSQSGKYRVSCFGGDRNEYLYLTKESSHSLTDGCYVSLKGPQHSPLLFTDSNLRDFFVPNGNFRKGSFEVLSYITDEVQIEDGHFWTLDAAARPASETTAAPGLEVVGNLFTNMPPKREGYVRRESLESNLAEILVNDRYPVVTLQGRGGVGKTSLALEVVHRIANGGDFFAAVWFSARDIDLLSDGPKVVRADVLSTDDVARDFSALFNPNSKTPKERRQYLTDCLSGQSADGPFLFIFDNFETIRDPAELYAHLNNAIRTPNKILITTRTRDFKADYPIEVRGMTKAEFDLLVQETATRLGVAHLMTGSYKDELFEESDGHPYVTKVLLGEVARTRKRITPRRALATKEAMLDALFDRSYATLSGPAQRVFLTLCSWRSLVPRIGLEAVLLRPANERLDIEHAINELEQTSLVEVEGEVGKNEEFLSVPLAAAIFGKQKLVTSPMRIAIEVDLEMLSGFGVATTTEVGRGMLPRLERLARTVAARAEEGKEVSQELAVIEYIATAYTPAWLTLSELQERQIGNTPAAIRSVSRYLESHPDDQEAWSRLVRLYRSINDPVAEMNARLQMIELGRPLFAELSSAASRLNGLLSRKEIALDADEKRLIVRKLRSLIEERHVEANATDFSRMAWLCMHDQDSVAAERWVEAGLQLEPGNQYCLNLRSRFSVD